MAKNQPAVTPDTVPNSPGEQFYCRVCGAEMEKLKKKAQGFKYWCPQCEKMRKTASTAPPTEEEKRAASHMVDDGTFYIDDNNQITAVMELNIPVCLLATYNEFCMSSPQLVNPEEVSFNEWVVQMVSLAASRVIGFDLRVVQVSQGQSQDELASLREKVSQIDSLLNSLMGVNASQGEDVSTDADFKRQAGQAGEGGE